MEVLIDLGKIRHNIDALRHICRQAGLQPVWITKGCQAYEKILPALTGQPDEMVGDVRPDNLARLGRTFPGKVMQIQLPSAGQAAKEPDPALITLVSHPFHCRHLTQADKEPGLVRPVILLVDVGNRREGVLPEKAVETIREMTRIKGIQILGVGTSAGCYGGYRVAEPDLDRLVAVADHARSSTGMDLPMVSVGSGTMALELARQGKMPPGVTQLRIGAALWVGEMPPLRKTIEGLYPDAFVFRGEILESGRKPALPAGQTGTDAFGRQVTFEGSGDRHMALLGFGMIDVDAYDLTPTIPGVRIVGATSNYTVCDVTEADGPLAVGDRLTFRMGYSAMARAMSSTETVKTVIDGQREGCFEACGLS